MSKNDIIKQLKSLKGNYELLFFSRASHDNGFIIFCKQNNLYTIFKSYKNNIYIIDYDLEENYAIKKYANLIS